MRTIRAVWSFEKSNIEVFELGGDYDDTIIDTAKTIKDMARVAGLLQVYPDVEFFDFVVDSDNNFLRFA